MSRNTTRIELIADHQHIEDEEDDRERKFEGLAPDASLESDHPAHDPLDEHAHADGEGPGSEVASDGTGVGEGDQVVMDASAGAKTRVAPGASPNRIRDEDDGSDIKAELREAAEKVKGKVRTGQHAPRSPEERLKAGVPYSESFPVYHWSRSVTDEVEYK